MVTETSTRYDMLRERYTRFGIKGILWNLQDVSEAMKNRYDIMGRMDERFEQYIEELNVLAEVLNNTVGALVR